MIYTTSSKNLYRFILLLLLIPVFLLFVACSSKQSESPSDESEENVTTIEVISDLVIGLEEQPLDHQLGQPIAVRTDEEGRIYIADRASTEVKVFDQDGDYLHSIGGRGRGPGEFLDMELMELTPEGNLVFMDRTNLRFTIITTEGEEVDSFPYNRGFFPRHISYVDEKILALFYNSSSNFDVPVFQRELFHIYSTDFQNKEFSFMPVYKLGYDEMLPVTGMGLHPGSFTLTEDNDVLFYSPSLYNGILYMYRKQNNGEWQIAKTIQGKEPGIDPYHVYTSEYQYKKAVDAGIARARAVHYVGEVFWGSNFTMDAGIFSLEDGRLIHFYAEWKEGYERLPESASHPMDLYVQIFNLNGELTHHSYLFSFIEKFFIPLNSVVNWMDEKGRFYLLEQPEEIPIVRRFTLDWFGLSVKKLNCEDTDKLRVQIDKKFNSTYSIAQQ